MKPKKKPTKKKATKRKLYQQPAPPPRKTIQLLYVPAEDKAMGDVPFIMALCDDGSIWSRIVGGDGPWIAEDEPAPIEEFE